MKDTVTFMNMNISKRLDTLLTEQQEKRNENYQRFKAVIQRTVTLQPSQVERS